MALGTEIALIKALGGNGGGSGGGLPEYTNNDAGKSLLLAPTGETEQQTVTFIQQQTVAKDSHGEGELAEGTYDFSGLSEGDAVNLTVNGVSNNTTVQKGDGNELYIATADIKISENGNVDFVNSSMQSATVSATAVMNVDKVAPVWAGNVLVVHNVNGTLDKTWNEIKAAMLSGGVVVQFDENTITSYVELGYNGAYKVYALVDFITISANGYPSMG